MMLFGGFKANFKLISRKKRNSKDVTIGEPICSAYRVNREELISNNVDPTKRNTTPIITTKIMQPSLKPSKSSNDVLKETNQHAYTRQSMPDIAQPTPAPRKDKHEAKEQKRIEKQQHEERKKREKLEAQEQQRQEKIKIEREKERVRQLKIEQARMKPVNNKPKKRSAPQPEAHTSAGTNLQPPLRYSTNTLESSISRSSGPPPYSAEVNTVNNETDRTGNTSFSQPQDESSWDMISQHRQHLNRNTATTVDSKQTHMDLHYNLDSQEKDRKDNSDA